MFASKLVDILITPFGRARVVLGHWPHREIVQAATATILDMGGQQHPETGSPAGELTIKHFRIRGHRLRLCIEDYDTVTLWGPTDMVRELSNRISKATPKG